MSDGTGGVPGLPFLKPEAPFQGDVNVKNIFDQISQMQTSMSSVLPYVQQQLSSQGQFLQPQIEAIRQGGETMAAQAQSDAMARGMRGSDIEAAGMAGARQSAEQNVAQLRGQLGMQQAQYMAEAIMKAYGYDVESNKQMHQSLAQAIGQELSQQRELQMMEDQLKAYKKAMREQSESDILGSAIEGFASALPYMV